jgi:ferredoxin-NADP reductase/Na+-translocating ferredoxin:NAD+ oxidoreductase RnfD subunit
MWHKFLDWIDGVLNRTTMYRLVLYYLIGLWIAAIVLSALHVLPYEPSAVFVSALFITGVCLLVNEIFARVFKIQTNEESVYITALILALIISPLDIFRSGVFIETAFWASAFAIASKYIFAIKKKHVFNPAAFGVVATALFLGVAASWWIGTAAMSPFVIAGGLLMVRKLRRSDLVWSFSLVSITAILATNFGQGLALFTILSRALFETPFFFFAFVMLTEPLTMPPTRSRRIAYGLLVGILFTPALHIGGVYSTPELALVLSNLFSYIVSPKQKLVLKLKEKNQIAPDMYDFVFTDPSTGSGQAGMKFKPGQYMEWTLGHQKTDSRGNRRYFTLASSPTENEIHLGVRFYERSSSFKRALLNLDEGDAIAAAGLAGDFTLPKDKNEKLVFIAGGIGITPFRSMAKYLSDKGERRDIILIYSNRSAEDAVYQDIFVEAGRRIGLKTILTFTETAPALWKGERGRVNAALIARNVPDWRERTFYISGAHAMVAAAEEALKGMGVRPSRIKTDFFPGFV